MFNFSGVVSLTLLPRFVLSRNLHLCAGPAKLAICSLHHNSHLTIAVRLRLFPVMATYRQCIVLRVGSEILFGVIADISNSLLNVV